MHAPTTGHRGGGGYLGGGGEGGTSEAWLIYRGNLIYIYILSWNDDFRPTGPTGVLAAGSKRRSSNCSPPRPKVAKSILAGLGKTTRCETSFFLKNNQLLWSKSMISGCIRFIDIEFFERCATKATKKPRCREVGWPGGDLDTSCSASLERNHWSNTKEKG